MNRKSMSIRGMIGLVGLAVGLGAFPAAGQATYEWTASGDGTSFGDPLNWLPNGVPGSLDEAKFDGAGTQSVSFASNPVTALASIENDTVAFSLSGGTYTTAAMIVGDRLTDVGVLTINGGHLLTTSGLVQIGRLSPSTGSLFVTSGATMTNQRDLIVGDEGNGYFQLDAGCTVTSLITFIADADTATGEALIRGTWNIQNSALIGNAGSGVLTVDSGGDVSVGFETKVGDEIGSSGSLTIDGAGSTLTSAAATTIGNFGTASLRVSNGGLLTTAQFKIADDAAASVLIDGGTVIDSVGTGVGNRAAGTLTLANGGLLRSPSIYVAHLGTVNGSGTFDGSVLSDGVINPGSGAGVLTVTGGYTQSLGVLNVQIGGPTAGSEYDQLVVNGLSTLGGTLNVSLINGYNPTSGEYVILQGGSVSGAFLVENLPAGFAITYEADRVLVSIGDPCIADFNGDGVVNTQDVLTFLNAWVAGDPSADINGDGNINTLDFIAYLNLWVAGC